MNTTIAKTRPSVNWQPATRSVEFVTAVLAAEITPYMMGALDAEKGELACPELYYTKRGQMCEYCEGYESVAGVTLTTEQFLGKRAAALEATIDAVFATVPVDDRQLALDLFDYDAEADDLIEARADAEYWAQGAW